MRLWSLHPKYLDQKGLGALWREGLLALHVLAGKTKGYRHHPQLDRFKVSQAPLEILAVYLSHVVEEARARGCNYDESKLSRYFDGKAYDKCITVTEGQVAFEITHLSNKLAVRDPARQKALPLLKTPALHPVFRRVSGDIEPWERV